MEKFYTYKHRIIMIVYVIFNKILIIDEYNFNTMMNTTINITNKNTICETENVLRKRSISILIDGDDEDVVKDPAEKKLKILDNQSKGSRQYPTDHSLKKRTWSGEDDEDVISPPKKHNQLDDIVHLSQIKKIINMLFTEYQDQKDNLYNQDIENMYKPQKRIKNMLSLDEILEQKIQTTFQQQAQKHQITSEDILSIISEIDQPRTLEYNSSTNAKYDLSAIHFLYKILRYSDAMETNYE